MTSRVIFRLSLAHARVEKLSEILKSDLAIFFYIFEVQNPLATTVFGTSSDSNADNFEGLPLPFLEVDVVRTSLQSKSL